MSNGSSNSPPVTEGFLCAIAVAEQQTPLPRPAPPTPDPNDPKYAGSPEVFARDRQDAANAAPAFAAAAAARGAAVSQVVTRWLATAPYAVLRELLNQPREKMPIFKPEIGPVIVTRHDHVIECLTRVDLFTVEPYAAGMAGASDDKTKNPGAFSHFILGTDRDELYRLDDVILRRALPQGDEQMLSALTRHEAEYWTRGASEGGEIDVVTTIGTFVPLRVVGDYLGIAYSNQGEPSMLPGLRGGDRFALDEDLRKVFSFNKIQEGVVPTAENLFTWIKDAFHNSFNNFHPEHPLFAQARERGLIATEYLSAYIHSLLQFYKEQLQLGRVVPDTMLTRLLRLQRQVSGSGGQALEEEFTALLGTTPPAGELARRLSDSRIRSNVFGTAVGALLNPQEATARIVDSMLRLKEGQYQVLNGSTYDRAVRSARIDEGEPGYATSLETLRRYALEALRLQPQAEVLLRLCVQDNTALGGILVRQGTFVIVAHAAAMRDAEAVPTPLAFDITRDERLVEYLRDKERAREAPQSELYLQHGYGRHKCLGRYASEITMRESLRALLRLPKLDRRSALEMDEQQLYAAHLRVGVR
jgi:cytochrome P450